MSSTNTNQTNGSISSTTTNQENGKAKGLRSDLKPIWCPGCGDYGAIAALETALTELKYESHDTVFVSGIGCSSRLPYFFDTYGFHSIHGRAPAVAIGIKAANRDLHVIVVGGDGDLFSIGTNHIIHAARRNIDLTVLCLDNHIYGLTKGQLSPTSPEEMVTSSSPFGSIEDPLNPLTMMLSAGATFVAQSFSGNVKHLTQTIIDAERHSGFSFVNIISPCVTFNKNEDFAYFKKRMTLEQGQNGQSLARAFELVSKPGEKIPLGTFYQISRPTFDGALDSLSKESVAKQGVPTMEEILDSFA